MGALDLPSQVNFQASGSGDLFGLTREASEFDVMSQGYYEERRGQVEKAMHVVMQKMQQEKLHSMRSGRNLPNKHYPCIKELGNVWLTRS